MKPITTLLSVKAGLPEILSVGIPVREKICEHIVRRNQTNKNRKTSL